MTPRGRKKLFNVLRIALCAGAMWIVIGGVTVNDEVTLKDGETVIAGSIVEMGDPLRIVTVDGDEKSYTHAELALDTNQKPLVSLGLKATWQRSAKLLLLAAIAIYFPIVFLQGLRIQWLLRAQEIEIGYWDSIKLSIAGNFLNFATPLGSNAGDVFKAYFLSLHTDRKTEAVTTVFLDRVVGLATLLTIVALITVFSSSDSRLAILRPYMLGMLGAGVVGGLVYFSPWARKHLIPRTWLAKLPFFEQLQRIDQATHALAGHLTVVLGAVFLTAVLQAIAVGAYFVIAIALELEANMGNVLEYYAYFCTGVVVQALPGPPQGLGTVELTYKYFLAPYGSVSQIVCVAVAIRLMVLICALPGLLVTLTGSYKPEASSQPNDDTSSEAEKADCSEVSAHRISTV